MFFGAVAGGHHGLEQLLGRVASEGAVGFSEMDIGFEHHGHGMVAYHAVRLVAGQLPHGQLTTLLEVLHGGVDEVDGALGLYLCQQGVQGTVGVPQREDRVHFPTLVGDMYLTVGATITAVHVTP